MTIPSNLLMLTLQDLQERGEGIFNILHCLFDIHFLFLNIVFYYFIIYEINMLFHLVPLLPLGRKILL